MHKVAQVVVRVAGVWIRDGSILVGRNPSIGEEWALPGGSLEPNELLEEGCRREFREELGFDVDCKHLVVSMEQRYRYKGQVFHELGFYFDIVPRKEFSQAHPDIRGNEPEMEFKWVPLNQLTEIHFVPPTLAKVLQEKRPEATVFYSTSEAI
jgi:ADP-ribose pyrophosphatase YjhB (NUDIX family)